MYRFNKNIILLFTGILIFGLISGFSGCSKNTPFTPNDAGQELLSVNQPISPSGKQINFITWNNEQKDGIRSLNKSYTASEWISKRKGGALYMGVEGTVKGGNGVSVKTHFAVTPNSISEDAEVTLTFDDEKIDFVFGPSGTTFDPPALLNLVIYGLDLTGVDSESIGFYYVSPDGAWEIMPSEQVIVNQKYGFIRIVNAQISHFSRYALSKD